MKKILLIRHAESISNAGERTDTHDTIPLSEKGRFQAEELAKNLDVIPELIVVSPFSRTRETAEPFIAKHPNVPVETWDVEEFTYLDPTMFSGTTAADRHDAVYAYWKEADVHHKTAPHVESFSDLVLRIKKFLQRLEERPENIITIFTHGRFIYALKLYMEKFKELGHHDFTDEDLRGLKESNAATLGLGDRFPIQNTSIHEIEL